MAKKKEESEIEIKLRIDDAQRKIKELTDQQKELNTALGNMGKDDVARKEALAQITQLESEVVQLRNSIKSDLRIIINGEVAGKTIRELRAAAKLLEKEIAAIDDPDSEERRSKIGQLATINDQIRKLDQPVRDAKKGLSDLGEIGSLKRLKAEAAELEIELSKLKPETEKFAQAAIKLNAVEAELKQVEDAVKQTKGALTDIGSVGSLAYLEAKAEALRKEIKLLSPATQEFIDKARQLQQVERQMDGVNRKVEGSRGMFGFLSAEIKQFGVLAASYLGLQALTNLIGNVITRSAELSDAITAVGKTTGLTEAQVKTLSKSLTEIDTRSSRKDLLELATVAGKLGLSAQTDVLAFVKAADQIKVALANDLGGDVEGAINSIGKLTSLFRIREKFGIEDSMLKVGSAINALGAASEANESYLVDFAKRFGGIAPNANISIQDVLGLAATLDKLGQTSEVSTTAIGQLLVAMGKDVPAFAKLAGEGTDAFREKLLALGVDSSTTFSDLLAQDANKALIVLLESLKSTRGGIEGMAQKLDALGIDGSRAAGVIGVLSNNIDDLKKQQSLSNDEFKKGTSLTNEFTKANSNFAAQLDRLKKNIASIFINDGTTNFLQSLVVGLNKLIDGSDNYIQKSGEVIRTNQIQAQTANRLIAEYESLTKKGVEPTAKEKDRLKQITYQLRDALGESVVSINKETGALEINVQKVKEAIKQKILLANQEASTLALKADALKEEINAGDITRKSLQEEVVVRKQLLDQVGLNTEQADYYYKILIEGGAKAEGLNKQMAASTLEAIRNYQSAQAQLGRQVLDIRNLEADRLEIMQKLKELGFKEQDVKNLFNPEQPGTAQEPAGTNTPGSTTPGVPDADKAKQAMDKYKDLLSQLLSQLNNLRVASIKNTTDRELAELDLRYATDRQKAIENQEEILKIYGEKSRQYIEYKSNTDVYLLALETKYQQDREEIIKKSVKQAEQAGYDAAVNALEDRYAAEKLLLTQQRAEGLIDAQQYQNQLMVLDETTLTQKLEMAKLFGMSIIEIEQAIADGRISEREREYNDFVNRELEKLDLMLALAEKGSEEELDIIIKKINLERDEKLKQYENDAEMRKLYEDKANQDIEAARNEHTQRLLETQLEYMNQFADILSGLDRIQDNLDQTELQKDKKKNDTKKKELKKQLDANLITKEQYDEEVSKLDAEFDKKQRKLKQDSFLRQQRADVVQSVINTALSVSRALSQPPGPPATIPFGILAGALGAIQTGVILSQPVPEFKKGTKSFVPDGATHEEGGIKLFDSKEMKMVGEMEGGEAIISKQTTKDKKEVIEDLVNNEGKNTYVRTFSDGGIVTPPVTTSTALPSINTTRITENIILDKFGPTSFFDATAQNTTERGGKQSVNKESNQQVVNFDTETMQLFLTLSADIKEMRSQIAAMQEAYQTTKDKKIVFVYKDYKEFEQQITLAQNNARIG